jgi:chaperone required for assembly of F1-ATPase
MPQNQRLKRFYKKVDVVEHPLTKEHKKLNSNEKVTLNNISLSHDKYYAVTLDGKVIKTLYKDNLLLPTRAVAVALAEEWES